MRVSAKAEYGCIAMLELAANFAEPQPVRVKSIADAHGIPARFLVQILLQLKAAGLGRRASAAPPAVINWLADPRRSPSPTSSTPLIPNRRAGRSGRTPSRPHARPSIVCGAKSKSRSNASSNT